MSWTAGSGKENKLQGYSGRALKLLEQTGAKTGARIRVKTDDGFEAIGLLIPRYESGSADHIVLKLKSGYNVGLNAESISSIELIEEAEIETMIDAKEHESAGRSGQEKTVLLLSTGGTIASRVDYRTGAVKPAYTAADLYAAVPELGKIAEIRSEVIFSSFSENLAQEHWTKLSKAILETSETSQDCGIVVMLGTDTLAYVSAALSFSLIGFAKPVVCVGAQRSSDRPSADSASNLKAAVRFARYSNARGVYVAMHANESDEVIAIHSGVRVRKNHTSRRDAFESIDVPHFAEVVGDQVLIKSVHSPNENVRNLSQLSLRTKFDSHAALVKFFPGFDPTFLDYLSTEKKIRGIIVEGTGLGHVSTKTVEKIRELVRSGIFVGITSQCIWGHVDLNVYETGIDMIKSGATALGNMLPETAYVKLSWTLGNFPMEQVKGIMEQNIVGEMTERIGLA